MIVSDEGAFRASVGCGGPPRSPMQGACLKVTVIGEPLDPTVHLLLYAERERLLGVVLLSSFGLASASPFFCGQGGGTARQAALPSTASSAESALHFECVCIAPPRHRRGAALSRTLLATLFTVVANHGALLKQLSQADVSSQFLKRVFAAELRCSGSWHEPCVRLP